MFVYYRCYIFKTNLTEKEEIDDLLKFMMELDIYNYFDLDYMMQFVIGLDILQVKKGVLQVLLITIMQASKLIHIILDL